MIIPNYKQNNIVNLMSSVLSSLGVKSQYAKLKGLSAVNLSKRENIVLIVLDGLGYEWLVNRAPNSFIGVNLKQKLGSVFPSTTAAAIPMFMSGYPAQQHGLTAWTVFLKEIGAMVDILPSVLTLGGGVLSDYGINPGQIYNFNSLFKNINRNYYVVTKKGLLSSDFNVKYASISKNLVYSGDSVNALFKKIKKAIKIKDKKYIYAYWPFYDSMCHKYGSKSKDVMKHFVDFDRQLMKFISSIDLSNTTVLLTADHGFVQTPKSKEILVSNHPKLKGCLTMPLYGEQRISYAYVKPSKVKDFEKYMKIKLGYACSIIKSEDAIKKNYFGLFKPNSKLKDRIGDYIIIMKENYILKDYLVNKASHGFIGQHTGVSKEEMYVPLVIFDGDSP